MSDQAVSLAVGSFNVVSTVLDANGNDITALCTISAVASDPTVISVGTQSGSTTPIQVLKDDTQPVTLAFTYADPAGNLVDTDTITVSVAAPASASRVYSPTPATAAAIKAKTAAAAVKPAEVKK